MYNKLFRDQLESRVNELKERVQVLEARFATIVMILKDALCVYLMMHDYDTRSALRFGFLSGIMTGI